MYFIHFLLRTPDNIYKIFGNVLNRRTLADVIYKDAKLVDFINNAISNSTEGAKKLKEISLLMGVKLVGTSGVSIWTLMFF